MSSPVVTIPLRALYYRYVADAEENLALGVALQKSWNEGDPDRDLLIGTLDWHIGEHTDLYASSRWDHYDTDDAPEDTGFELTQANVNLTRVLTGGHSLSVYASRSRWPQYEGSPDFPDTLIVDGRIDRFGLYGRYRSSERVTLHARADGREDQDGDGHSLEAGVSLSELAGSAWRLDLSLFDREGGTLGGFGWRMALRRPLLSGALSAAWIRSVFEAGPDLASSGAEFDSDYLRLGWDGQVGSDLHLRLYLEARQGDDENATTLGFRLGRSF